MTEQKLIGPSADELPALAVALADEVAELLSSPRWRLLMTSSKIGHHAHAAAALRHTVALLADVVDAVGRQREAALRVLGRAHLEAWLVGMYLMAYGDEALADIEAGYVKAISAQQARLTEYDEALRRETAAARKRNKRIRAQNRDRQQWNEAHPEGLSKQLLDEVPVPKRRTVGVNLVATVSHEANDDTLSPLALSGIVARLNEYAREQEGIDAILDLVYDLGYRGLSTLGAHPTLWVINNYLDYTERGLMVSSLPAMRAASMGEDVLYTAVMLTAALAQKVIGLKGDEAPTAAGISARYHVVEGA